MDILTILSQFSPMATIALALFIIWQLIKSRRQISTLGSNHIAHMEENIKRHIDAHEHRELEQGRRIIETLQRINDTLIRIDSRKGRM